MKFITDAFEEIAHSLRILTEVHVRSSEFLMELDRDEAVGNIEHALSTTLNAFSSLHDAMTKEGLGKSPEWYSTPELATILILRNARHHNHARRIRTVYSYYIQEAKEIGHPEEYLMTNIPSADAEDGGKMFEIYQSWGDLKNLFAMPRVETKIRETTELAVRNYIQTDQFTAHARQNGLSEENIFFNVIPLLVNAGVIVAPFIKDRVDMRTNEGKTFLNMFTSVLERADPGKQIFIRKRFSMRPQHG